VCDQIGPTVHTVRQSADLIMLPGNRGKVIHFRLLDDWRAVCNVIQTNSHPQWLLENINSISSPSLPSSLVAQKKLSKRP